MSNKIDLEALQKTFEECKKALIIKSNKKRIKKKKVEKNSNKEFGSIEGNDYYDRYYKRWSNEEDDRLIELYNENDLNIAEIAEEMGRTKDSIGNKITELRRERGRELERMKKQEVLEIEG